MILNTGSLSLLFILIEQKRVMCREIYFMHFNLNWAGRLIITILRVQAGQNDGLFNESKAFTRLVLYSFKM